MAAKAIFDVTNRRIEIIEPPVNGVSTIDIRVDLYSDGKEDWELNADDERSHRFPFITSQTAGQETSGGRTEPVFFRLRNGIEGWRILPHDSDHVLTLIGTLVPNDETVPLAEPRPGRTIVILTDGSEVAQLTQGNTLSIAQQTQLSDVHGQVVRSVFIDTEKLAAGNGYQQTPFNTWTAAVDYAEENNLVNLVLLADAVVDRQLKNFVIDGVGVPAIDLNGQIMDNTIVRRCQVTGSYTGQMQANESALVNLSGMAGVFLTVTAAGTLTVAPNSNLFISRVAPAIAAQPWTLSMNSGQPSQAAVHNITGGLIVTNMDHAGDVLHLHFAQGELTIDASCTLGGLVVTGDVKINNNSAGTTLVDKTTSTLTTDIHKLHGLELGNPMTVTPASRKTQDNSLDQVITGDGETTSTVTRQ